VKEESFPADFRQKHTKMQRKTSKASLPFRRLNTIKEEGLNELEINDNSIEVPAPLNLSSERRLETFSEYIMSGDVGDE
jgi:hypothetical protein